MSIVLSGLVDHISGKEKMMVRPNKGDRQMIATRIPRAQYEKLHQYVELAGTTKTYFIRDAELDRSEDIIQDAIDENQDQLPITAEKEKVPVWPDRHFLKNFQ